MDCKIFDLGCLDYEDSFCLQKQLHKERQQDLQPAALLILEHPPVITFGRSADKKNILAGADYLKKKNIKVIGVDRGGDVTIHMPGQLVAYPIFDLRLLGKDIHLFIRTLEQVMLEFLSIYRIKGQRVKDFIGAWVSDRKIGFVGIGISKWISFHGLSININCDLEFFSLIRPCGIPDKSVTSLAQLVESNISYIQAKRNFLAVFKRVFDLNYIEQQQLVQI